MVDPVSGSKAGPFLLTRFGYGGATVSPDGNTIAYVGNVSGPDYPLYMQDTVGGAPHVAFANCDAPAWAPNGAQLACWERDTTPTTKYTLVMVNTDGGGRHPVYGPVPFSARGEPLSWSPDSSKVVTTDHSSVFSVPAAGGGSPTTLVPATAGDTIYSAAISPDGGSLAFV